MSARDLPPGEAALVESVVLWRDDPLRYVREAFEWRRGDLLEHPGPDDWQRDILEAVGESIRSGASMREALRVAVASGHGVGKALAHGEPVLTPRGWRPIESLSVGDEVVSADGTATRVVGVFPQGERDLFRVRLDDGCSVVVDADHLWMTTTRSERKHGKDGAPRTTRAIAESLTFANGPVAGLNHQIPALSAVRHPTALLPVEPYLFGCWLGDGDAVGRITGMPEGFEQLAAAGASMGAVVTQRGTDATCRTALGIRPALRALGLFGCRAHEKFIPECYLRADVEQRTALLQGLLDTDGHANGAGNVAFDVTAPRLADDTAELVRSLGGVVRRSEKIGSYGGKQCRRVYRLFISLPRGISPLRIPRKADGYAPHWGHRNCDRTRRRHIAAVEPAGRGLATCIAVDHPSHLFVTRDHIVTHNSALVAWLILWAMSTRPHLAGVVTANTGTQLETKTWRELALWNNRAINSHWFKWSATKFVQVDYPETWFVSAIPWAKERSEAFAGQHAEHVLVIYDEASAIDDAIWEVSEGAMTTPGAMWFAFGNPTRNTGRFREAFGRFKHRWITRQIDSRTARMANRTQIEQWVADYGEDSDFVRVRVRGVFPRAGSSQFIDADTLEAARTRPVEGDTGAPIVMGVDVARFGDDQSVILFRQGRDARSIPSLSFRGIDTMALASKVVWWAQQVPVRVILIDGNGVGGGVVDRVRQLTRVPVIEVQAGGKARNDRDYVNRTAEAWDEMRRWLKDGGAVEDKHDLIDDLGGREYGFDAKNRLQLEKKDDLKKRGLASPDHADALALTFAEPVGRVDVRPQQVHIAETDYPVFG